MKPFNQMNKEELQSLKLELEEKFAKVQAQNLHLDMSR